MASEAAPSSSSASSDTAAGNNNAGGSSSYRRSSRIEQLDGSDTVTLVSMDGDTFVVDSSAVVVSKLLDAMVDGEGFTENFLLSFLVRRCKCSCAALLQQFDVDVSRLLPPYLCRCVCVLPACERTRMYLHREGSRWRSAVVWLFCSLRACQKQQQDH